MEQRLHHGGHVVSWQSNILQFVLRLEDHLEWGHGSGHDSYVRRNVSRGWAKKYAG